MKHTVESINKDIEELIGQLYVRFYRLRELKEYKEEYSIMDTLHTMLSQDKMHLLKNHLQEVCNGNRA